MRQKGFWVFVACVALLAVPAILQASGKYRVLDGPKDFYYGHISYTEAKGDGNDPVVLREGGGAPEVAILNLPLGPGDTIRTSADRRCEIQFDSGTIIRLDVATELRIETILAQSLSSAKQLSNLILSRGRLYVMYKEYGSREMFQILTPSAALKMDHKTVAIIRAAEDSSTDIQVKFGKASAMFGPDEKSLKKQDVRKMERLAILKDHQFERSTYVADSDFELWNNEINANFDETHKGLSNLPAPIQNLPAAVFYFAQKYGNPYGEWLWDDLYGYVWRPFLNEWMYPWGDWAPYVYGSWSDVGGQLFWVPGEPWGWIPYHLGIWQWDKKLGWVWLPGSLFAPAWVDWEFFFGYSGWRPWSLFDWFDGFYTDFAYINGGWYYGLLGGNWPGSLPGPGDRQVLTSIRKDQLKQPDPLRSSIPKELAGAYKRVLAAYKNKDARVLDSINRVPSQAVFVSKAKLNASSLQAKALSWEKLPKVSGLPPVKEGPNAFRQPAAAREAAARVFRANEVVKQLVQRLENPAAPREVREKPVGLPVSPLRQDSDAQRPGTPGTDRPGFLRALQPSVHPRFLDWNPDIKIARELGVRIEYSALKNEIRCPELRLSSQDRVRAVGLAPHLTSDGVSYGPATSVGDSGSGGSGGSSQGGGGRSSASTASSSHGSTREGSSEGGARIKN
jgi:hypothetical protein